MKTIAQFFPLMILAFIIGSAVNVNAQGRGHHRGHYKDDDRGGNHSQHHWDYSHPGAHKHHKHGRRNVHHHHGQKAYHVVHHHDHHCDHAPVVVHHYPRPRYIYYRDYNVYYDMDRSVYISWSGRNWTVSASLPVILHRVDIRRAVRMEVDYDRDNFTAYLETGRPLYRRVYTEMY